MAYTFSFEKLSVWQLSRQFSKKLYLQTKSFPKEELFGITSQTRRAAVSISCNLAEGSARKSPKEQYRFYEIAFSSAAEVVNLLILSKDLAFLSDQTYNELRSDIEKTTWHIHLLMKGIDPSK